MNFGNLLDRYFDVVGDRRSSPRMYSLPRAKELLNAGFRKFRIAVQDHLVVTQQALTATQSIYDFPANTVRAERIAYDDRTLSPVTVIELLSENYRWHEKTYTTLRAWTTEDVQHNEYRVYPIPDTSSTAEISMVSEVGILGQVTDVTGAFVPFDTEEGFLGQAVGAVVSPEEGILGQVVASGTSQLTLWLVDGIPDLESDNDQIPIRQAYALSALYYALHETYLEQSDHYNPELADYYEARFESEVRMALKDFADIMPHMLVGVGADRTMGGFGDITWPSQATIDGVPQTIGWSKEYGSSDGDEFYQ